jgi:hypothetical protein
MISELDFALMVTIRDDLRLCNREIDAYAWDDNSHYYLELYIRHDYYHQ